MARTAVLAQGAPGDFLQSLQLLALMALARNTSRPHSVVSFPVVPELRLPVGDLCHQGGDLVARSKSERFCQDLKQGLLLYPTPLWQSGLLLAISLSRVYCCAKQLS